MTSLTSSELGWSRWRRSWWYHGAHYAETWRGSVVSSIFFPFFFLASLGVGVGHLVNKHSGLVDGQTFLHFIAPSLLATTAMQMAENESTWPVLASVKWFRNYQAAVSTPLEPEDVYVGKVSWVATRAFATSVVYTLVIGLFGAIQSWWALSLPFIGTLIAVAFSAPLVAFAATVQSDGAFVVMYRFIFVPMFLFSATFYPLSAFPGWLRPLIQFVPLYHGVALTRAAAYGQGSLGPILGHLVFLLAMVIAGVTWGRHTLRKRLVD